jgi:hypothetical protein
MEERSTLSPAAKYLTFRFDASPLENRWAIYICLLDECFAASHHVGRKKNQPLGLLLSIRRFVSMQAHWKTGGLFTFVFWMSASRQAITLDGRMINP